MSDGTEFSFPVPMMAAEAPVYGGPFDRFRIVTLVKDKAMEQVAALLNQYKLGGLKLPDKATYLAAASRLYDQIAAAIDIPYLGEEIEKVLEAAGKPSFMKLAEMAYDAFVKS